MAEPTTVTGKTAEQVTPETVTEGQLDTATQPTERSAAQISADELTTVSEEVTVKAAQGNRDAVVKANLEEIRNLTEPAKFAKIEKSVAEAEKADNVEAVLQSKIYDKDVRGSKVNLVEGPDAEYNTRTAITDTAAQGSVINQIAENAVDLIGYDALEQRQVTGTAAKSAAADMIAATAFIPKILLLLW